MERLSYSAHLSRKNSAINSKAKLAGVAKHNLRKYHSNDCSGILKLQHLGRQYIILTNRRKSR